MADTSIDAILMHTVDPHRSVGNRTAHALSTLLVKVCDGNEAKFNEATRLITLFILEAQRRGL